MKNSHVLPTFKTKINGYVVHELVKKAYKRLSVYQFWYQIYHAEMNRLITDLDHSKKIIFDDLEPNSTIFVLTLDRKIIATVRLSMYGNIKNSKYFGMLHNIRMEKVVFLTKFMVRNECRNNGLGMLLINLSEEYVVNRHMDALILDCNNYMIPFSRLTTRF